MARSGPHELLDASKKKKEENCDKGEQGGVRFGGSHGKKEEKRREGKRYRGEYQKTG